MRVLAAGLEELGILPISAEEALAEDRQLHRRYTLHGTSHMLGLDVHDCAHAREEEYRGGRLQPGHVLTVEPGLYFQPDDLTVPEALRGIGIRIEDDVLVTEDGCRVLSGALPTRSGRHRALDGGAARPGDPAPTPPRPDRRRPGRRATGSGGPGTLSLPQLSCVRRHRLGHLGGEPKSRRAPFSP